MANARSFTQLRETFGFDTYDPWALSALELLYMAARVYDPLTEAWNTLYPGTKRGLEKLRKNDFVVYQKPIIINSTTQELANRKTPSSNRYRITSAGRKFLKDSEIDIRVVSDQFPRLLPENRDSVLRLLRVFLDTDTQARSVGVSAKHATDTAPMRSGRTGRWWITKFVKHGLIRQIPVKLADQRVVIPGHYRMLPSVHRQLKDLVKNYPKFKSHSSMVSLIANHPTFAPDITSARINISGATDYDHDVDTQTVLAKLMSSPSFVKEGRLMLEPRVLLTGSKPKSITYFSQDGPWRSYYYPDAEMRERSASGTVWKSILEYERFQNRKDGWAHIERFLAYNQLFSQPFEPAVLRFVVKSESRLRSYRALVEAFGDYLIDFPSRAPSNVIMLAVSSYPRLMGANNPLDPAHWAHITLPTNTSTNTQCLLHDTKIYSPYDEYFSKTVSNSYVTNLYIPEPIENQDDDIDDSELYYYED